jgi:fatty acid/phospholipid biosynthesis enzyme
VQTDPGKTVLALDVHGGDFGPAVTIPAALDILECQPDVEILACGMAKDIDIHS